LMRAIAASISRPAATAWCAASGVANGAPNKARKPSPKNLLTMPPWFSRLSTSTANAPSSRSTTCCRLRAWAAAVQPRKPAKITDHHGDLADVPGTGGALRHQPLHHLGRDVLAEQAGDAIARGRSQDAGCELPTQLHPDRACEHAADQDGHAAGDIEIELGF